MARTLKAARSFQPRLLPLVLPSYLALFPSPRVLSSQFLPFFCVGPVSQAASWLNPPGSLLPFSPHSLPLGSCSLTSADTTLPGSQSRGCS
jgi:hypothetical protein